MIFPCPSFYFTSSWVCWVCNDGLAAMILSLCVLCFVFCAAYTRMDYVQLSRELVNLLFVLALLFILDSDRPTDTLRSIF